MEWLLAHQETTFSSRLFIYLFFFLLFRTHLAHEIILCHLRHEEGADEGHESYSRTKRLHFGFGCA